MEIRKAKIIYNTHEEKYINKVNLIQKSTLLVGKKLFEKELKTWRLDKKDPNSVLLKQRPEIIHAVLKGYSDLMQHFFETKYKPGSPGQAKEAELLVRDIQRRIDALDSVDNDFIAGAFCGSIIRRAIDHTKKITGEKYAVY